MAGNFKLSWEQKQARDALGIKKVNKKRELDAINTYIAGQQKTTPQQDPVYSGGGVQGPTSANTGGAYPWDKYQALQENLANIEANAAISSAGIRADADKQIAQTSLSASQLRAAADKEIAKAYADAQRYNSELSLEGVKYASDTESKWRQAIANIEVKGKLDLQPIINAGLERVAGIGAEADKAVAETTGKYSLLSTKEQTAAQERIGKMQLAGSMYGLLGAAFG